MQKNDVFNDAIDDGVFFAIRPIRNASRKRSKPNPDQKVPLEGTPAKSPMAAQRKDGAAWRSVCRSSGAKKVRRDSAASS